MNLPLEERRYSVKRKLKTNTYLAFDSHTNCKVVVKILKSQEQRNHFLKKARVADQFRDAPNIVKFYGYESNIEKGYPYIVIEYLKGCTLKRWLKKTGSSERTKKDICQILLGICEGIKEIHDLELTHGSIKPRNIFLNRKEGKTEIKILDFGTIKQKQNINDMIMMMPNEIIYSYYTALTSSEEVEINYSQDVYSIAAIAYELVENEPYLTIKEVNNLLKTMERKQQEAPPQASVLEEGSPLREAINKGLISDSSRRISLESFYKKVKQELEETKQTSDTKQAISQIDEKEVILPNSERKLFSETKAIKKNQEPDSIKISKRNVRLLILSLIGLIILSFSLFVLIKNL